MSLVYAPSFRIPFLFDDHFAIVENPTIRDGLFSAGAWQPPAGEEGTTVQGRPLLNASFALSHSISGLDPWAYHVMNLAIHLINAILLGVLLGLLFRSPRWRNAFGARAVPLAFGIATLWALHPLQTLAVSYVVQRAESLVSLFYLGTLTAWFAARHRPQWAGPLVLLSVTSCALGMLTKEVIATAPIALLALDWATWRGTDLSRSLRWGRIGVCATWGILVWILAANDFSRGGTTGTEFVSRVEYLATQAYAIPMYVGRILWPVGITFDHGTRVVDDVASLARAAVGWLAILAPFGWLLARRHVDAAIALSLFFLLLAPTSSLVPIATQTIAEHRVYLASSVVIAAVVVATWRFACALRAEWAATAMGLAAGGLLAFATFGFNRELQHEERIWERVAHQVPSNWRAFNALGRLHAARGDDRAALEAYEQTLALHPRHVRARYNRGNVKWRLGDWRGAIEDYREVLRDQPEHVRARNNLAMILRRTGDRDGARRELERVVADDPRHASAWYNLALVRLASGDAAGSRQAVETYLTLRPDSAKAWSLAAEAERLLGDEASARASERRAASLTPDRSSDSTQPR